MKETTLNKEFYALVEPLLLSAGYEVTYGRLVTIRKGRFIADLLPYRHEVGNGYYLCFRIIVRAKDLKRLNVTGRIVLANALSMIHPGFNIAYHHSGCALALRYQCDLYEPKDIRYQLEQVKESYTELRNDMQKRLPDFIKQFPRPDTQEKQLVKELKYLHRWRLE